MTIIRVPDDFTVWAFADPHGMRDPLAEAFRRAGLIDAAERWIAPAGTALVGCGDYIDRGPDSAGVLDLLFRLRDEAAASGSLVVLARGNHEALLEGTLRGIGEDAAVWVSDFAGGTATAVSLGLSPNSRVLGREARDIAIALIGLAPELPARLAAMPDAVRWHDVLFCHAGPVEGFGPDDLGARTDSHLWQHPGFERDVVEEWDLASPNFAAYRAAGIGRYVFGHESQEGPTVFQAGQALCLDTNATGGAPGIHTAQVTLARIPPEGSLFGVACVVVETELLPDRDLA
jgi:serine/threonine protein phosphatase 1